jgi:hypothetical protein
MKTRVKETVSLACCDCSVEVVFDEADAPSLAPRVLRRNVSCPGCSSFVIISLLRRPDGTHQIEQEVFE